MTHIANILDFKIEDKIAVPGEAAPVARNLQAGVRAPGARARRFGWRSVLLAGAAVIAVAAAGDFGWNYWTTGQYQVSTDDAYVKADTTVVAPKVSGYLRDVLVADNEAVKAGQPLARIDDRDYAVAVEQAKADVTAAQADVTNVEANLDEQQAVIAQTRATVEVDRANLTYTQQDNARYSSLARTGAGSVQNE